MNKGRDNLQNKVYYKSGIRGEDKSTFNYNWKERLEGNGHTDNTALKLTLKHQYHHHY